MAASRSPRLAVSRAAHNVGDRDEEEGTLAQPHVADLHHQFQPAVTVGRGVPIQQRDTQRILRPSPLRDRCWRFGRSAAPPRSRAPRSHRPEAPRTASRDRRSRRRRRRGLPGRCVGPSRRRRGGLGAIRDGPATIGQCRDMPTRSPAVIPQPKPAPLVGSPSARSMTVCDHRKISPNSPASSQLTNAMDANPMVRVGSPIDSSSAICSDASRDALTRRARRRAARWPARSCRWPARPCPRPRCTTPAAPRSGPGFPGPARACKSVAHSMVRGAMRIVSWSGSSAGSASAIRRARSQLSRAATRSRLVDHAPARMCQPYAACSSPAA